MNSKSLRKFLTSHQSFLRNCSRFGIEIAFLNKNYNHINNYEIEVANDGEEDMHNFEDNNLESENNQDTFNEFDNQVDIESAENLAFEIINDENSNDEITIQALSFLHDVVYDLRKNTNIFYRDDICISIVELLHHQNLIIIISTLKLIVMLTQGSRKPINILIKNDLLSVMNEVLFKYPENNSIYHFIIIISSNIASLSYKKVHYLIQHGYSDLLHKALNYGNINIQLAAAFLSSNIMIKGAREDVQNSINSSILDHLFQFLDEDYEPHLFHCILDGILNCLQNQIFIDDVPFEQILKEQQYYDVLYSLSMNKDEYTSELAQCILPFIEEE